MPVLKVWDGSNWVKVLAGRKPTFATPSIRFGTTNAAGSTLTTIHSDAVIKLVFAGDSGQAVPDDNELRVLGAGGVTVTADGDTLTVDGSGVKQFAVPAITFGTTAAEGTAATLLRSDARLKLVFAGDSGTAVPSTTNNTLNVVGAGGVTVTADGDTLTVDGSDVKQFAVPAITFGTTPSEGTAATLLRSDARLKLVFAGDSGQAVPDPSGNTLNVVGGLGVTVTANGNTLQIDASGVEAAFAVPSITFGTTAAEGTAATLLRSDARLKLVFAGDSGTAAPSTTNNTLNVVGAGGITVTADGNTLTISGGMTNHTHSLTYSDDYTSYESSHTHSISYTSTATSTASASHTHTIYGEASTTGGENSHTHSLTYTNTATSQTSVPHTHNLYYDEVLTAGVICHTHGVTYLTTGGQTSTEQGHYHTFGVAIQAEASHGHYYRRVVDWVTGSALTTSSASIAHIHNYDKANTPTGAGSSHSHSYIKPSDYNPYYSYTTSSNGAAHTHDYDKANTPTGPGSQHRHTYSKTNTPTGGVS